LHEITHILGFAGHLYHSYVSSQYELLGAEATIGKNSKNTYIKSPNVLATGREHFGCSTLQGVGLENAGGSGTAGAHWERSELGDEYMTGADINEPKLSKFTLALLKDSGWYDPVMSLADTILFGKGAGCGFITEKC